MILSSTAHSVILTADGHVVADYPFRIFEVMPDGTMYREAGAGSTYSSMRLGMLLPNGSHAVSPEHPINAWHYTLYYGSWGVWYSKSMDKDLVRHVDIDGVMEVYDVTGMDKSDAKYAISSFSGSTANGWIKLARSLVFVNRDGRAKLLRKNDLDAPGNAFTIASQTGEWLTFMPSSGGYGAPGELIRIAGDGSSAKAASLGCQATGASMFSRSSEKDSKLIMNCYNKIVLVNLGAESKFKSWNAFVGLDDLVPETVTNGPKKVNFGPLSPLSSSGLMSRTDATFSTILFKP